jgi:hypothetical protein
MGRRSPRHREPRGRHVKVTLDCGCKTESPKLTGAQVFYNYSRSQRHAADLLVACPSGHGLRGVK